MKTKKRMTNNEYVKEHYGCRCPYCLSTSIQADGYPQPEATEAVGDVHCESCGKRWSEIWTLNGWFSHDQ